MIYIYIGELYYANNLYVIYNAIRVKDWIFAIERAIYDTSSWFCKAKPRGNIR